MIEANVRMNDYRRIRVSPEFRRLRPADTAAVHARSRRWLEEALAGAGLSQRTVVVTHHAPSRLSLDPTTAWQLVSAAYASNLDALVAGSGVPLWVHGHTHCAADYRIGETRVLSNPRGYPGQPVPGFDPALVVEV
ncbi:MAG TPA: hypothetical protein VMT16_15775 [Thermoanaerobaculia bacterium]|nr:hypothetical protein [Thermoanaerobaculia bacterium]